MPLRLSRKMSSANWCHRGWNYIWRTLKSIFRNVMLLLHLEPDRATLNWARGHVDCQRIRFIIYRAWSKTFELTAADHSKSYLKVMPPEQNDEIRITTLIARYLPSSVPEVIAYDIDRGFLLLRDHEGVGLISNSVNHTQKLISCYASLEAQATKLPRLLAELPAFDASKALEDLLFSLAPDRYCSSRNMPLATPAAFFLGAEKVEQYRHALMSRSTLIQDQLNLAGMLQSTITHGDLHVGNAAMLANGQCVFYDWSEAGTGPVGLSLCHPHLFPGSKAIRALMDIREGSSGFEYDLSRLNCSFDVLADIIGWREIGRNLMNLYINQLVSGGYGSRDTMIECLPGSLLAGVLRWLVGWTKSADYDIDQRRFAAGWMRAGLDDFLEMLRILEVGCQDGHDHDQAGYWIYSHSPHITIRQMGDKAVLTDPEGKTVYHLNLITIELWRLLSKPKSLQQATVSLLTAFPEAMPKQIEADALVAFVEFVENEFVVAASDN